MAPFNQETLIDELGLLILVAPNAQITVKSSSGAAPARNGAPEKSDVNLSRSSTRTGSPADVGARVDSPPSSPRHDLSLTLLQRRCVAQKLDDLGSELEFDKVGFSPPSGASTVSLSSSRSTPSSAGVIMCTLPGSCRSTPIKTATGDASQRKPVRTSGYHAADSSIKCNRMMQSLATKTAFDGSLRSPAEIMSTSPGSTVTAAPINLVSTSPHLSSSPSQVHNTLIQDASQRRIDASLRRPIGAVASSTVSLRTTKPVQQASQPISTRQSPCNEADLASWLCGTNALLPKEELAERLKAAAPEVYED